MYSGSKFTFSKIPNPFSHNKRVCFTPQDTKVALVEGLICPSLYASAGEWPVEGAQCWGLWKLQGFLQTQPHLSDEPGTFRTAAHRTPRIQVRPPPVTSHQILSVTLKYSSSLFPVFCRQYSVGFEMVTVSTVGDPGSAAFQKKNSGDYRCNHKTLHVLIVSVLTVICYSNSSIAQTVSLQFTAGETYFLFWLGGFSSSDVASVTWRWNTSQQASTTSPPPPSCPNRKDPFSWILPVPHLSRSPSSNEDGWSLSRGIMGCPWGWSLAVPTDKVFSMEESVISEDLERRNSIWNKNWQLWGIFTELCVFAILINSCYQSRHTHKHKKGGAETMLF